MYIIPPDDIISLLEADMRGVTFEKVYNLFCFFPSLPKKKQSEIVAASFCAVR